MNKNIIAFSKRLVVCPDDHQDNRIDAATANAEVMRFGYMLTEDAFNALKKSDPSFIHQWTKDVVDHCAALTGDGDYKMLHAGFPKTVMNMNILERYFTAIQHYWSNGTWFPDQEVTDEGYSYEYVKFKFLELGTETQFDDIFKSLVIVNQSLAPGDMNIIEWFADNYATDRLQRIMPASIPFKENLCVLAAKGLPVPVKTPTDVMRIAGYMSWGDTDIAVPPKTVRPNRWSAPVPNDKYKEKQFRRFGNDERRHILSLLENVAWVQEMAPYTNRWKTLGHGLHPGDHAQDFPRAYSAIQTIRNKKVRSWYGRVDMAFRESYDVGIAKLSERPGEFARRLDMLLRQGPGKKTPSRILTPFRVVATKVSNKVLFELLEHFQGRNKQNPRSVWIKGARQPTPLPVLPPMSDDIIETIVSTIWGVFSDKFALLEPLGAVWIDPKLENIPAPTNMRSVSEGLSIFVRGQRNPITANKKVLRCFVHWTAANDLDLSVEFCDEKGENKQVCAFHDLAPHMGVVHSGDVIPHTKGKWAEYVDIILDKTPFAYALMNVRNYSRRPLKDTGAVIGFMERDTSVSGDRSWSPKTIAGAAKIETDAHNTRFCLIDIANREWIFLDEDDNKGNVSHGQNIAEVVKRVAEKPEVSAWTILNMHAEARGKRVENPEDADVLFKFEDFSTSYEQLLAYML